MKPPAAVQTATDTYRTDSDKLGNFINECLTKTDKNSKAKDVYEAYTKWCEDNGYGCENKGNFFAELKTKGLFMSSGTVEGKTVRNIVRGYTIETDFIKYVSAAFWAGTGNGAPYQGAKNYFLFEEIDNIKLLNEFVRATWEEIPMPKPKKPFN